MEGSSTSTIKKLLIVLFVYSILVVCVCIYVRQELACEPKQAAADIDAFLGDLDVFQVWAAGVGAGGLI